MNCANHPERERVSFCQNCGKPLCAECTRAIGAAVFCEPCLAARLAAADTATSSTGAPYGYTAPPNAPFSASQPPIPGAPNPALAALLGIIPGVGAMYNAQYAKGVVHLIIFAVLVSLSDNNGIFGMFVAGWVCYQVFESYQTARARRDGTPLPNPFGLNDIGERFGLGKAWSPNPAAPPVPPVPPVPPPPGAQTYYRAPDGSEFVQGPGGQSFTGNDGSRFYQGPGGQSYTPPSNNWGAPTDTYGSYAVPPVPPVPPIPPYGEPFATDPAFVPPQNRFPTGAIWLIGLGVLFFIGSSGLFRGFPIQRVIPILLIGFGVWIFVRKMTSTGAGISDDGSPDYRLRLFRALKSSVWIILVGVLFFLDTFDILSWGHSWPLFIIVAGLMAVFRGSAYSAAPPPYGYPPSGATAPPPAPPVPATASSIVPVTRNDEEGR